MNRKQIALIVVLAMTSAFIGGSLSSHLCITRPALAARSDRFMVAQGFRLIDYEGITRALLQLETRDLETSLTLFDRDEKPKIKFLVDMEGNASAHFWQRDEYESKTSKLGIQPCIQLEAKDLEPSLTLFARDGSPKIKLLVDREGNPSAHFWDKRASDSFKRLEEPSVIFWDSWNNIRSILPK
jgi:hypothetical protein